MTDMHSDTHTNGVTNGAPPYVPELARVVVPLFTWAVASTTAKETMNAAANRLGFMFARDETDTMRTEPLVAGGAAMGEFVSTLTQLGIEHSFAEETPAPPLTLKEAAAALNEPDPIADALGAPLESRVLIGRQSWLRVKEKTAAKVMSADRECNVGLSTTPTGAMMTNAFPKGDVRIVAFASALEGLKVKHSVFDAPPGADVVEPVDEPTAKTPRGSARAERRADAGDDEENDTSLDVAVAHAMGEDFAAALRIVLKATPKRGASPAISHVVLASDPDKKRLELAAHDGCRWHLAFVPTSDVVEMVPQAIQLRNARSLLRSVEYAVKERKLGARVGFAEHTGNPTRLVISCGKPDALMFELKLAAKGEPEGWRPPRFSRSGDATAAEYDARAIAEATAWKGARVTRDECDAVGRRHITLMDQTGVELMRAVIVASGLTEGLPEEPQLEIEGALTPKKKRGKKSEQLPLATGPAVRGVATGQWRLERTTNGTTWATEKTGTDSDILDAFRAAKKTARGDGLRTVDPQGIVAKIHEAKAVGMTAAERKIAKPAAKKPAKKLETNVTVTGARKPVKLPKRKPIPKKRK